MTWFDVLALAIVFLSLLLGLFRGFVREVLSLAGWVAAALIASRFAEHAAVWMPQGIPSEHVRLALGFFAVFVVVLIVASLLGSLLGALARAAGLGFMDRMLGAIFGIARGVLILVLFVLAAGLTPLPRTTWWATSLFTGPLERAAIAALPFLPEAIAARIRYR